MNEIVAVYAIFDSDEEARRIGRAMVEARLAACVNILGACHSIYRWQDTIEEAREVPAIFKTGRSQAAKLIDAIREAHRYDVPAIVMLPIEEASPAYRAWVTAQTG
ncbi:MAG: divalent-cation tolerance protein CutA [Sphingomonas sp.]